MTALSIVQAQGVRDPALGLKRKPWGFLLHTTGGGVTDLAKRSARRPIDVAIKTYIDSQNGSNGYLWGGPSYVIDYNGDVYRLAPDEILTAHAGGQNRPHYFDGSWATLCPLTAVDHWRVQWGPRYKHPYELFPSRSPNNDYVGCEMIPCGDGFGTPRPGTRFTQAQHDAAIALARNVGARNAFPDRWHQTSRLLGHEDVDPMNRSDAGGGWDPGFLRATPYFDFAYVRAELAKPTVVSG